MRITVEHSDRLFRAAIIYIEHPNGVKDAELAVLMDCTRATACNYRHELASHDLYEVSPTRYTMRPTADMVAFAHVVLARVAFDKANPHRAPRRRA